MFLNLPTLSGSFKTSFLARPIYLIHFESIIPSVHQSHHRPKQFSHNFLIFFPLQIFGWSFFVFQKKAIPIRTLRRRKHLALLTVFLFSLFTLYLVSCIVSKDTLYVTSISQRTAAKTRYISNIVT